MNLREVQLSSRAVIPVALALPINREPAVQNTQTCEHDRREGGKRAPTERSTCQL